MNNEQEQQSKDRLLKILAIGGFIGLIIIIAWLSIKLVSFLPNALTSLASLADSVYNYQPAEIVVVSNKNMANTEESFKLTWNVPTKKGTFAFSYECLEKVSVDIRASDGIKSLDCDTNYNIGNVDSLELIVRSEKERFVDFKYAIDFIANNSEEPEATAFGAITIVNANISPIETGNDDEEDEIDEEPETVSPTTTPATSSKPVAPAPKPTYIQEYIYSIPTSDPKGYTDLEAKFISSGMILSNGVYSPTGYIDNDGHGAVQFVVKNIGTKTSDHWTFEAKLPNGTTYESPTQAELKPNERAIVTVSFTMPKDDGIKNIKVSVAVRSDSKPSNNYFNAIVLVK